MSGNSVAIYQGLEVVVICQSIGLGFNCQGIVFVVIYKGIGFSFTGDRFCYHLSG